MAITGSQPAYSTAQGGVMRGGSSRGNVTTKLVFIAIDGVHVGAAPDDPDETVLNDTLSITEQEGESPNTASFVANFPLEDGADVVMTFGSKNNLDRLFGGRIMTDATSYTGIPSNAKDAITCLDYTWELTRYSITQRFTNESATDIARAILALAPGWTSVGVAADLPIVDEMTFTNVKLSAALGRLAERIGGYGKGTYRRDYRFGLTTDTSETDPTELTAASSLLLDMENFAVTRDLLPVITRQAVEGGGSTAYAAVAVGSTTLPVVEDSWYNPLGGTVVSGPQRIAYTGIGYGYTFVPSDWQAESPGFTYGAAAFTGIVWAEALGLWVAVYPNTSSLDGIMTSPDGVTWTSRAAGVVKAWEAIAWSPELALLVAVGLDAVATSTDGITWTPRTPAEDSTWQDVCWADDLGLFVAVADTVASGTHQVMTSPDGITWTARTAASGNQWYRVTWSQDLALIVAISLTGATTAVMTSPNGTTWTTRTTTAVGRDVAWSPELALFVKTGAAAAVETSPDGIAWTNRPAVLPAAGWRAIVWAPVVNRFVALSDAAADNVAVSADGVAWSTYTATLNASGRWALDWAPSRGQFMAGGFTGALASRLMSNSAIVYPTLTGIPPSGAGAILYNIAEGDPVNLRVVVDDGAAQALLATRLGGDDGGIIEGDVIQDGRISETEALARAAATLAQRSLLKVDIAYTTKDKNSRGARTIPVDLPAPQNVSASFGIKQVTISGFAPSVWPTFRVAASNWRQTFADLLRRARGGA